MPTTPQTERERFEAATAHMGLDYEPAGLVRRSEGCTYWQATTEAAFCAWKSVAALASQQAAPADVPEGWKLVPIEPTARMLAAVGTYSKDQLAADGVYRAMLSASPPPSAEREVVPLQQDTVHLGQPSGEAATNRKD